MSGLTALKVKNAKPGRHGDGAGLYLLVSQTSAKSWVLRVQVNGRRRDIGLGALSDLTLAEARDKARELRKVARTGGDPIAARDKDDNAPPSFKDAATAYHAAQSGGWSDRTAKAFLSTLELHAFPRIGRLRVDSIDEKEIVAVLSPLWTTRPAAARKLRQRIGMVLDFARGHGWRSAGAPRETLRPLLAKQPRGGNFDSMPYADVPAFVAKQDALADTSGRLALLFTILTAARSGEVREALWSQIDEEGRLWSRPAEMMRKNGEAHSVTLSPQALGILDRAKALRTTKRDCLIFPGARGKMSDMTMSKLVRPTGYTVHGFRSSFRTWAAEQMPAVPEPVAEAALAHLVPDQVVRAYQRAKFLEMRRSLLNAWGEFTCE